MKRKFTIKGGFVMRRRITPLLTVCLLIAIATIPAIPFGLATALADEVEDATGTDPRDFSPKFMPYYRYTELENDLEVNEFVLFGMYAFTPKFALTYEWPLAMQIDYSDVDGYKKFKKSGSGGGSDLPTVGNMPGGGGGLPFDDLDRDGDVVGLGDLNLRFFLQIDSWRFKFMD
jgi:hypothetical protein